MGTNFNLAKKAQEIAEKLSKMYCGTLTMSELFLDVAYRIVRAKKVDDGKVL